jgi:hypothetical protein
MDRDGYVRIVWRCLKVSDLTRFFPVGTSKSKHVACGDLNWGSACWPFSSVEIVSPSELVMITDILSYERDISWSTGFNLFSCHLRPQRPIRALTSTAKEGMLRTNASGKSWFSLELSRSQLVRTIVLLRNVIQWIGKVQMKSWWDSAVRILRVLFQKCHAYFATGCPQSDFQSLCFQGTTSAGKHGISCSFTEPRTLARDPSWYEIHIIQVYNFTV